MKAFLAAFCAKMFQSWSQNGFTVNVSYVLVTLNSITLMIRSRYGDAALFLYYDDNF